ncbi:MAG: hypothetical protein COA79_16530 [Planctomycetota bacterium]|nr:MAG: hypothetical protein COA79_16530 [Planctomycetota bacterium]
MKLFSYEYNKKILPGILIEDNFYDLSNSYESVKEIIENSATSLDNINLLIDKNDLKEIQGDIHFKSPICFPNKLMCVAGNYIDHIKEGGGDASKQKEFTQAPWLFLVPPTTVMIGHNEKVVLPKKHNSIDYEGELAFVIGKGGKDITQEDAHKHIFGYTIFNDVSERKPFMIEGIENPRQLSFWYKKSFDTFGPCGPTITTADEINNPQDLKISVKVNGELKQECNTKHMIFDVYKLVEFVSSFLTLEPGDIISTGTPAGVGMATGIFMQPNDTMEIDIDGLGTLTNQLVEMD